MNIKNNLKKRNLLFLFIIFGTVLPLSNAFALCGIARDAANFLGIKSNCIYEDHSTGAPAGCDDTVDVTIAQAPSFFVRHNDFQHPGTQLAAYSFDSRKILNGYIGDLFKCRYVNARQVYQNYVVMTPAPEIISNISGDNFSTAPGGQSADVGVKFVINGREFPNAISSPINDIGPSALIGGSVASGMLSPIQVSLFRVLNQSGNSQTHFDNQPYLQLVFKYYPRYNDEYTEAFLRVNLRLFPDQPLERRATCGVSINEPNVSLGVTTPAELENGPTKPVPFHFNYHCDGSPDTPVKIGLQPTGTTMVTSNLLRAMDSTSIGVGVAFSDKSGDDFVVRPWVPKTDCQAAGTTMGFCSPDSGSGNTIGTVGWLPIPGPITMGKAQTLYARMQKMGTGQIRQGSLNAQVNVLITHD